MLPATVSCGQPCVCCQITYGAASTNAAIAPPAAHQDHKSDRGPITISEATITAATRPTWGLASTPTTTPAASTQAPLPRTTARTASHPKAVVLNMSNVVVLTKWATASANPEQ